LLVVLKIILNVLNRYYDQVVRDKDKQIVIRGGAGGGHRLLKKYKQLGWTGVAGTSLETVAARREKQMAFRKMQSEKLTAGMQTTKVRQPEFVFCFADLYLIR
jgi:hypothetical protein